MWGYFGIILTKTSSSFWNIKNFHFAFKQISDSLKMSRKISNICTDTNVSAYINLNEDPQLLESNIISV